MTRTTDLEPACPSLPTLASPTTLIRPGVSLAVAFGSLCGALFYVLYYKTNTGVSSIALAALGAFLTTAGCSVLNQVQERERDALMQRTKDRLLPSGRMRPRTACALCLPLLAGGIGCFALGGGWPLAGLGALVVLIYNGMYTPLKPHTPLALLFGGVAGALPPLTGWIAAGGNPVAPPILTLTALFYLWQVPHFWLLAEKRRHDYLRAGYALPGNGLSPHLARLLRELWVAAYFIGLVGFAVLGAAPYRALASSQPLAPLLAPLLFTMLAALGCAGAVAASRTGRMRLASVIVDGSLPLALAGVLVSIS